MRLINYQTLCRRDDTSRPINTLTCGSWLLGFALGLRQYSSNVSGTTMPSFSASVFASRACFLQRNQLVDWTMMQSNWLRAKSIHANHLIMFGYSLSRPFESLHRRYITLASTFAGLNVFGSLSNEITDRRMVRTFCVGFHRSQGNSPLCGSSTGGCKIEMHKSPFS